MWRISCDETDSFHIPGKTHRLDLIDILDIGNPTNLMDKYSLVSPGNDTHDENRDEKTRLGER